MFAARPGISPMLATLALSSLSAFASPPSVRNTEVPIPATHIFAPTGFDSNDSVEVIVKGYLPNTCYKSPSAAATVKDGKIDIQLTALHTSSTNAPFCAQLVIPFIEVAKVGVLDQGAYPIEVNAGLSSQLQSQISVAESTSAAVDDFVYARVESVQRIEGTNKVRLVGENPSPCFDYDQVKLLSNGQDTFSVLPILKQVATVCPQVLVPFSYEVEIPDTLPEKEVLLHVRVMNGKSVNALFTPLRR